MQALGFLADRQKQFCGKRHAILSSIYRLHWLNPLDASFGAVSATEGY